MTFISVGKASEQACVAKQGGNVCSLRARSVCSVNSRVTDLVGDSEVKASDWVRFQLGFLSEYQLGFSGWSRLRSRDTLHR